jgi:hypothetical protein
MIGNIKILIHQGIQSIPDIEHAEIPGVFRGTPVITNDSIDERALVDLCPTNAISSNPISILENVHFVGSVLSRFQTK